jgi:hypothetical protein
MTRASSQVQAFVRRAVGSLARRLRNFAEAEPAGYDLNDIPSSDLALYFPDGAPKLYQLIQWLPVFEASDETRTIVVVRQVDAFNALQGKTSLRVLLVPNYEDLMALYSRADFRAVIYVNNGWTNFQSLAFQEAVHIHVNHGESDKICMVSNQAKAYDKVFVAGEAAVQRHASAIAWFDTSHLVRIGRPQLDLPVTSPLADQDGPTITYAPTWEGEDAANNYTSVDRYGIRIIEAALAQPGVRVIYKPHPRVLISTDPGVRSGHRQIMSALSQAAKADPTRGHAALPNADILGILRSTDLLIADVSSVTLDHLYLRPAAPIMLCDRRTDREQIIADTPLAAIVPVIDDDSIASLAADLGTLLTDDPDASARTALRHHYFDNLEPGQSTERFWSELRQAIAQHDSALGKLSRRRIVTKGVNT